MRSSERPYITQADVQNAANNWYVSFVYMDFAVFSGGNLARLAFVSALAAAFNFALCAFMIQQTFYSAKQYPPSRGFGASLAVFFSLFFCLSCYGTWKWYRLHHGWFW